MSLDILLVGEESQQRRIDRLNFSLLERHNVGFVYTDRPESWARNTVRDYDMLLITSVAGPTSKVKYLKKVKGIAETLNHKKNSINFVVAADGSPNIVGLAKNAKKAGIGGLIYWNPTWNRYYIITTSDDYETGPIPLLRKLYAKNEVRIQKN